MKRFLILLLLSLFPVQTMAQEMEVFGDAVLKIEKTRYGRTLKQPQKKEPKEKTPEAKPKLCVLEINNSKIDETCENKIGIMPALEIIYEIKEENDTPQKKRLYMQTLNDVKTEILLKTKIPEDKIWMQILTIKSGEESLYITQQNPKADL